MIIGGTAIDLTATISSSENATSSSPTAYLNTSTPGRVRQTLGGVGRNIAETSWRIGAPTVFISAIGLDAGGEWVERKLDELGMVGWICDTLTEGWV